jgi:hypothetical protein
MTENISQEIIDYYYETYGWNLNQYRERLKQLEGELFNIQFIISHQHTQAFFAPPEQMYMVRHRYDLLLPKFYRLRTEYNSLLYLYNTLVKQLEPKSEFPADKKLEEQEKQLTEKGNYDEGSFFKRLVRNIRRWCIGDEEE